MSATDQRHEGQEGARTRPAPEISTAERAQAAVQSASTIAQAAPSAAERAAQAILAELEPQAILPGLTEEAPETFDLVAKAAETVNAQRRGPGRPKGSANMRNAEMFDYLEAMGFKQPERRLMEIISADPAQLAAAMSGPSAKPENMAFDKVLEIMRLQLRAAEVMLPYKFAKRQELNVKSTAQHLHVMVAGRLTSPNEGPAKAFSLTGETLDFQQVSPAPDGPVVQGAVVQSSQAVDQAQQSSAQTAD